MNHKIQAIKLLAFHTEMEIEAESITQALDQFQEGLHNDMQFDWETSIELGHFATLDNTPGNRAFFLEYIETLIRWFGSGNDKTRESITDSMGTLLDALEDDCAPVSPSETITTKSLND